MHGDPKVLHEQTYLSAAEFRYVLKLTTSQTQKNLAPSDRDVTSVDKPDCDWLDPICCPAQEWLSDLRHPGAADELTSSKRLDQVP